MKLNRIKVVLAEKGISQTWLVKQFDKGFIWLMPMLVIGFSLIEKLCNIAEILQADLKDLATDKKMVVISRR